MTPRPARRGLRQSALAWPMIAVLFFAQAAVAQQAGTLTGDWGGARSRLLARGVDLTAGYTSEVANNPRGGPEDLTRYADQWAFGATVDLHRLLGWNAGQLQLTVTDRNGRNLGNDANLQTLQQVQEVYGRGQTWRLTQFWYRRAWFDGRLDWKLGRVTVGEDFASFSCNFQNLTFCGSQPGNVRGELWYNWPVSQWGTRLALALGDETSIRLGVYQVNPRYVDDSWARHDGLSLDDPAGTTGSLIPLELGWTPKLRGLPGSYKVGAWVDTSGGNDVLLDVNRRPVVLTGGAPLHHRSRSGVYLNFEQQVSGSAAGQGADLFLNITQSDRETATAMDRQIAGGVQYSGPFASRPGDAIGLALGVNHVNGRVAEGQSLLNATTGRDLPVPDSEIVAELYYGWSARPGLTLRPNLQVVRHPGGIDANATIVVIGLKTVANF